MSSPRLTVAGLQIAKPLYDFVADEALPGAGLTAETFWRGVGAIVSDLGPRNRALLDFRDRLQAQIDTYHRDRRGRFPDPAEYLNFLREIGYLIDAPVQRRIPTANVDDEIARIAGPQLVVPLSNARYALNAANARWGSLYDALYGTDAVPESGPLARNGGYNTTRGAEVVRRAKAFLDSAAPLTQGRHGEALSYAVENGALTVGLAGDKRAGLKQPDQFAGFTGNAAAPGAVLLRHHGLHLEIIIDHAAPVGRGDPAGVADVVIESAITAIMDMEDSVAAVDAEDKVLIYRNWLGLMKGDLTASFTKGSKTVERRMNPDRVFTSPD